MPPSCGYTSEGMEVVNVRRVFVVLALLMAVTATAQDAYVVLLRNGERVVARQKYVVKGSMALVTLKNGTLTSIPLSQIDVAATEKLNARDLGDAVPLDWIDQSGKPIATPTPTPSVARLGHIDEKLAIPQGPAAQATPTPGISLRGTAYPDKEVDQAFCQGLESYHLYLYRTSEGTRPGYYFMQVQVNGQPEVLRALQAVTRTYQVLAKDAPARAPKRVELQLLNESGREAGLFRISAEEANELAGGKVSPEDFFVQHVIF